MTEIDKWLSDYSRVILDAFGARVLFIGIQGSRGRGEASEQSDIDVVLILDKVGFSDLELYRKITASLPHRELLCGFVSGRDELQAWDRADLFQFFFDTRNIYGDLKDIIPTPSKEDARRAVSIGACNIYHACSHNYLHEMSADILAALYKSARFVLQAKHFCETGEYISRFSQLKDALDGRDKLILDTAMDISSITDDRLDGLSRQLLEWASQLIVCYKER